MRAQCLPEENETPAYSRYIFVADEINAKNIWDQSLLALQTSDE